MRFVRTNREWIQIFFCYSNVQQNIKPTAQNEQCADREREMGKEDEIVATKIQKNRTLC